MILVDTIRGAPVRLLRARLEQIEQQTLKALMALESLPDDETVPAMGEDPDRGVTVRELYRQLGLSAPREVDRSDQKAA